MEIIFFQSYYKKKNNMNLNVSNPQDVWNIITIALPILEVLVRLIPSEKPKSIIKALISVLYAIVPDRKKGGGFNEKTLL